MNNDFAWAYDQEGNERKPFPIGGFFVRPGGAASVQGADIIWKRLSRSAVPYDLTTFDLLEDLLNLENASDDRLADFAMKYGPLKLPKPMGGERESLEEWRALIRIASGLLRVAQKIENGTRLNDQDWTFLGARSPDSTITDFSPAEHMKSFARVIQVSIGTLERNLFGAEMNSRLWLWGVVPRIRWDRDEIRLELGGRTLLSGIGAQLLAAACRSDRFYICSWCCQWYRPTKTPRRGERHYCSQICRRAGACLRQKKYEAKKKSRRRVR